MNATQAFYTRRETLINQVLANPNPERSTQWVILAKNNLTVASQALNETLAEIPTNEVVDFELIKLVRVLAYTDENDAEILEAIRLIRGFWMNRGDDLNVFWSENHILMWHSSIMALNGMYPSEFPLPDGWRERMLYYLADKAETGFYEYFSTTYSPYSLAGLINMYDFAIDAEIKELARLATLRLLRDYVRYSTDKGAFFLVQGRYTSGSKVTRPYQHNHHDCIALLTGKGPMPDDTNLGTGVGFLAVTDLNVSEVYDAQEDTVDETLYFGLSTQEHRRRTSEALSNVYDRHVIGWSMGRYFTPEEAGTTFQTIGHYDLWDHQLIRQFRLFRYASPEFAVLAANVLQAASGASSANATAVLFRHKDAMVSSLQHHFPGFYGVGQQMPFIATTGSISAFTHSGPFREDWDDRKNHAHLPNAEQKRNVALVMYMPNRDLAFIGARDPSVSLYWANSSYNQVEENGKWVLGREDDAYVAIYRHCLDERSGIPTCDDSKQLWACVVGHADLHASFENFSDVIKQADVKMATSISCIDGSIDVDGQFVEFRWCHETHPVLSILLFLVVYTLVCIAVSVFACQHRSERSRAQTCGLLCLVLVVVYPGFVLGIAIALVGNGSVAAKAVSGLAIVAFLGLHVLALVWAGAVKPSSMKAIPYPYVKTISGSKQKEIEPQL